MMWGQLEAFYHVAKLGSFTKAAERIYITQSALSRKVLLLEDRLQEKLFHRGHSGLSLTYKGKETYRFAEKTIMSMERFKAMMMEEEMEGILRIHASPFLWQAFLNDPLIDFSHQYPKIHLEVIAEDQGCLWIPGEVDLALGPYDKQNAHLVQIPLMTLRSGFYASSGYLQEFGTPQSVEDLKHHRLLAKIGLRSSELDWILKIGLPPGERRMPSYQSNSFDSLLKAAQKGLGIMSGYQDLEKAGHSGLIRILPEMRGPLEDIYLIYPKYLEAVSKVNVLRECLLQRFNRLQKENEK